MNPDIISFADILSSAQHRHGQIRWICYEKSVRRIVPRHPDEMGYAKSYRPDYRVRPGIPGQPLSGLEGSVPADGIEMVLPEQGCSTEKRMKKAPWPVD